MGAEESPRTEAEQRGDMAEEALRIECWARTWDATYRRLARNWSRFNTLLVVSAALLAAVSGATVLGELAGSVASGLIALAAAAVSGSAGALGASTRASQYIGAAAANSGLADAARVFGVAIARDLPLLSAREQFTALCKRRDAAVSTAPVSGKPRQLTERQLDAWPPGAETLLRRARAGARPE